MTFAFIFSDVGVGEWFVLLAVILIVVGPKRLPETARKVGQYYARLRRAADNFKRQIMDMDSEFGRAVADAKREVESAAAEVNATAEDMQQAFSPAGDAAAPAYADFPQPTPEPGPQPEPVAEAKPQTDFSAVKITVSPAPKEA